MSNMPVKPLLDAGFKLDKNCVPKNYKLNGVRVWIDSTKYTVDFLGQYHTFYNNDDLVNFLKNVRSFSDALNIPEAPAKHEVNGIIANALEDMGFERISPTDYHLFLGKGRRMTFLVVVKDGAFSECYACGDSSLIKSLDQLKRVIKELKSE